MENRLLRAIMLHEFKLGHSGGETTRNIVKAWGPKSTSKSTVLRWFKRFASGDESLEDEPGRGRHSSIGDEVLKAAVEANPKTTTRALAADLGVHHSTVARHLADIGKVKKMEKWIPHDLTPCPILHTPPGKN